MNALIGHTGFVGTFLKTKLDNIDLYNSKNITDICGKKYNTVFFCGLPATKWLINQNPKADLDNMQNIQNLLKSCEISKFILISTIDVYDKNIQQQNEDGQEFTSEPYGLHRRLMEKWVENIYQNHHIIRLPALFGVGLKKNIIYDILTENTSCKINLTDSFQWYFLDDLYDDIKFVISNNISSINFFSEPIKVMEFNESYGNYVENNKAVCYDYHTKYSLTTYFKDKNYILNRMASFIHIWKLLHKVSDNIIISNLCWKNEEQALETLKRYKIKNVELALTKYYTWNDLDISAIKNKFKDFNIYSLQSLFFGLDFNIFLNTTEFIEHFRFIAKISQELGIKRLVFGSPYNRLLPKNITYERGVNIFVKTFQQISTFFPEDIIVCIEHNATEYNCNFLNTVYEVINIVQLIDRSNIKVNMDTGNAIMMNDHFDYNIVKNYIGHVQVSAPFLESIVNTETIGFISNYIKNYNGKASLEARNIPDLESNIICLIQLLGS
jgi:sugar phosphate isomerase/epimerase